MIFIIPFVLLLAMMFLMAFVYAYWWAILPLAMYLVWRDNRCTCRGDES